MLFKVIKSTKLRDIWTGLEILYWKIQFCYTSFLHCVMLGSFLFYCKLLCPRLELPVMSMFSVPTDFCEIPTYGRMARKKSSKIIMKMHMFHVNNTQALRIPGRHLYNKCMQGDSLFNIMKHLEHSPTLRPPPAFCCVFSEKSIHSISWFASPIWSHFNSSLCEGDGIEIF